MKREKKEAEEKVGLGNLLDEHEAKEFNENLKEYGKYVSFTVTNINKPTGEGGSKRRLNGHSDHQE